MKDSKQNLIILFFTLVVVMMGFGMVIPILPFYIKSFGASGSAMGALMASYAISQVIFARRNRRLLLTTKILLNAIAPAANIGFKNPIAAAGIKIIL
jgi:MFS family permease